MGSMIQTIRVSTVLLTMTFVTLLSYASFMINDLARYLNKAVHLKNVTRCNKLPCITETLADISQRVDVVQDSSLTRYCNVAMAIGQTDGAKDAVNEEDAQMDEARNSVSTQRSMADDLAANILATTHVGKKLPIELVHKAMLTWRPSPNPNRKRIRPAELTSTPSDTIGLTKDSVKATWHVSPIADRFPNFVKMLLRHLYESIPEDMQERFYVTTMSVNVDFASQRHRDCGNEGPSFITAAGDYIGGKLLWWDKDDCRTTYSKLGYKGAQRLDISGKFVLYNGKQAHEVEGCLGKRTSVVYYCWYKAWTMTNTVVKKTLEGLGFRFPL